MVSIITEMKKSNLILISAYVMQKRRHLWKRRMKSNLKVD